MSALAYQSAKKYLNLQEWPGAKHNPQIVEFFEEAGHGWVKDDETPWCAAFVGAVLAESGMVGTGRLNARSYMGWGCAVESKAAQKGDIVVLWRGAKNGVKGHVGFFHALNEKGDILILGGNQDDRVSVKPYPRARLLGIRRARSHIAKSKTMRAGTMGSLGAVSTLISSVALLEGLAQLIVIACGCVAMFSLLFMMRERIKKWILPA